MGTIMGTLRTESDLLRRIELRYDFVKAKMAEHTITESGCWEYQGYTAESGYGTLKIYCRNLRPQKRTFRAHRVSFAFFGGADPGEHFVCHRCDNPACINPDHLYLGTPLSNTQDMWRRSRAAPQQGEHNGACKLTEATVVDVVAKICQGMTNKQIAHELPVTHSQVSLIRLGKSWTGLLERLGYDPEQYRRFKRKAA